MIKKYIVKRLNYKTEKGVISFSRFWFYMLRICNYIWVELPEGSFIAKGYGVAYDDWRGAFYRVIVCPKPLNYVIRVIRNVGVWLKSPFASRYGRVTSRCYRLSSQPQIARDVPRQIMLVASPFDPMQDELMRQFAHRERGFPDPPYKIELDNKIFYKTL